jgi:recombination protein RecA
LADALEALLKNANKKYNLSVGPISEIAQEAHFITTGNIAIDHICGGGLPLGRSVELAGPPSSGKTTTALQTAAELQKVIIGGGDPARGINPDDKILYLDYEQTIDQDYCTALGLDIDHPSFLLTQPDTLEDGANFAREAVGTGRIRLVIWDSVASMVPSMNAQNEIGKSMAFTQARLMSDLGQQLNPLLSKHNTLNIFVNHLKTVLDMTGRRPSHLPPAKDTPGGASLKFYASIRLEFKQLQQIQETVIDPLSGEEVKTPGATNVEVKVTKNKVAPPFRKAVVRVRFGKGFDNFWTAMQLLMAGKEVMHQAGYFYFHKVAEVGLAPDWMKRIEKGQQRPYIRTEKRLFAEAEAHPDWRQSVIEHAAAFVRENKGVLKNITPEDLEAKEAAEAAIDEEIDDLLPAPTEGKKISLG